MRRVGRRDDLTLTISESWTVLRSVNHSRGTFTQVYLFSFLFFILNPNVFPCPRKPFPVTSIFLPGYSHTPSSGPLSDWKLWRELPERTVGQGRFRRVSVLRVPLSMFRSKGHFVTDCRWTRVTERTPLGYGVLERLPVFRRVCQETYSTSNSWPDLNVICRSVFRCKGQMHSVKVKYYFNRTIISNRTKNCLLKIFTKI